VVEQSPKFDGRTLVMILSPKWNVSRHGLNLDGSEYLALMLKLAAVVYQKVAWAGI
jgi:hypothetical protein